MTAPTFNFERDLWRGGYKFVAGVDEVGRGCFAGPVVAAAVVFPGQSDTHPDLMEINDSKLLTPQKRNRLSEVIKKHALSYAIAEIGVADINEVGIGRATQKAFLKAIMDLQTPPDFVLIDAFYIEGLTKQMQKPIVHGDRLSLSIAAASIIAKVYRDELMEQLDKDYELYDFKTNKGYGTKKHRDAIREHGLTDLHRMSFNLTKFTV